MLLESVGPALDAAMFSVAAGDDERPAGLMNGIAPLTAASAGDKTETIVDDVQALAVAVAPVAGNNQIVLVASPELAVALALRMPSALTWPVITSSSLAPKTVIAIAANALVSAVDGVPAIEASAFASVHRETVPGEIADIGGVMARPIGSVFQTDEVALKMRWPISWALRDPRGLAWMNGDVNW